MSSKLFTVSLALLMSSSAFAFTDSVWIVGAEGYPGDLVPVEVWLQYEGGGPGDSMACFEIPLTYDASVCTVEAIIIGTDFIDGVGTDWRDVSRIDNAGVQGPPAVPKIGVFAFTLARAAMVERGIHFAATVDFRILDTATPGDSTYVDSLEGAFSPPHWLSFVGTWGMQTHYPAYAGSWVTVTSLTGDVRPTAITSPHSDIFVDSIYFPSAVIRNFGRDSLGPVPVSCAIGSWIDSVEIPGIPGFASTTVDFAGWRVPEPGVYAVTVTARYAGDPNSANDTLSVPIRAYLLGDVGPQVVTSPPDTVYLGYSYVPSTTIRNFEADSAGPIPVTCDINSWTNRVETGLIPGNDSATLNFLNWTVPDTGLYSVSISTDYVADTNSSNDVIFKNVYAVLPTVMPTDSLWVIGSHGSPGELVPVAVWLQYEGAGYGDSMSSLDIPLTWDATACTVEGLTIGQDFAEAGWVDMTRIDNEGTLGPPPIPKMVISFFYYKTFKSTAPTLIPRGAHLVANIDFRILDTAIPGSRTYVDTLVEALSPPRYLGFTDKSGQFTYKPTYGGGWIVLLAADKDAGPTSITNPPAVVFADSTYTVSAVVRNFGCNTISLLSVVCSIDPWADTAKIPILAGLDSATLDFGEWTVPDTGVYSVTVFTQSHGDPNPLNDTLAKTVQASVGVDEVSSEPAVPSVDGLSQGYPNPMSRITTISYQVAGKCEVSLKVFDSAGRFIKGLVEGEREVGYYSVKWDGKDYSGRKVPSGVYFLRLAMRSIGEAHTPGSTRTGRRTRMGQARGEYTATRKVCVVR